MPAPVHRAVDRAQLYFDYVWAALSDAARKALEMLPQTREYQHEGLRRAKAEGQAEGEARGRADGKAQAVIDVLEARGLTVNSAQRERILASNDLDLLRTWLKAALTAGSTEQVIGV